MSRNAEATLEFGGQDRLFRLGIGRLRSLQEKTDCGPYELHRRFTSGEWKIDDVRETIRQGLIGGGLPVIDVDALLKTEFDGLPKGQFVGLANAVVLAELVGVEDEPEGESKAGAGKKSRRSRATS